MHLQVLSGDSIVIRGLPMGGPPPEKTVYLSNIQAPKLARRGNPNVSDSSNIKDEVCKLTQFMFSRSFCFNPSYDAI